MIKMKITNLTEQKFTISNVLIVWEQNLESYIKVDKHKEYGELNG